MPSQVKPSPYVELSDVYVQHNYAEDDTFEHIADQPIDELNEDAHFHRTMLLHRNARVYPDEPAFGVTTARVTLDQDGFQIHFPRAPHMDWFWTAHANVLGALAEDGVEPASSDATAYYNHVIGHPLLDASFVDDLLSAPSTTVTNHDADWYEPSHTVVKYELEDAGDVFLDLHTDEVYFDGAEDLRTQFNYHISSALEQAIDEILVDVNNPYEDVFDETVLYPAFAQQEALVPFWNAVVPSLFDGDFASDPDPELRDRTEELGMQPLQAFLGWLIIGSCLEHEIPAFGQTSQALGDILGDTPTVNWANTTAGLGELGPAIEHAIDNQLYEYTRETLPEHDELLRIHANREHMELAVETIAYRPVYSMNPSDDWSENRDVSDFFWAEGCWHLKIKAARPCPHEEEESSPGEFDPTVVYEYMDEREGDRTLLALASNISDAEPITQEEVDETMVSVVGAPTPDDEDSNQQ